MRQKLHTLICLLLPILQDYNLNIGSSLKITFTALNMKYSMRQYIIQ